MSTKRGLGRTFDSLIPTELLDESFDPTADQDDQVSDLRQIKIDEIMSDKPRKYFDGEPNIFIGTYQSLEKWSEEFFKQFDVVCTDECLHPDTLINTINGKKKIRD